MLVNGFPFNVKDSAVVFPIFWAGDTVLFFRIYYSIYAGSFRLCGIREWKPDFRNDGFHMHLFLLEIRLNGDRYS